MLQAIEQRVDQRLLSNSAYQSGRSRLAVMIVETRPIAGLSGKTKTVQRHAATTRPRTRHDPMVRANIENGESNTGITQVGPSIRRRRT
jgi:hypothetical protein